jgi:hypothetical protein
MTRQRWIDKLPGVQTRNMWLILSRFQAQQTRFTEHKKTPVSRYLSFPMANSQQNLDFISLQHAQHPPSSTSPGSQTWARYGRFYPFTPFVGWLRIVGMRRVRVSGTYKVGPLAEKRRARMLYKRRLRNRDIFTMIRDWPEQTFSTTTRYNSCGRRTAVVEKNRLRDLHFWH